MANYAVAANAYRQSGVQTASPERLLLMLYDGLLRFMRQAQTALETGDYPEANKYLTKSQDIVRELHATLKMEYEVSSALAALYDYFYRKLIDANIQKDPQHVIDIIPRVEELQEAWTLAAAKIHQSGS